MDDDKTKGPEVWVAEAMKSPLDWEVSRTMLGWSLCEVGREVSLLITKEQAAAIIAGMEEEERWS
jgi:hypothetical protein